MAKKIEKLRDQGTAELGERQRELADQLFRLRFQLSTGQAEAVSEILRDAGLCIEELRADLAGITRCVVAGAGNGGSPAMAGRNAARQKIVGKGIAPD